MVVRNVRQDNGRALLEMLDHLRKGSRSAEVTVRILAAADHDGICAAKMLSTILNRTFVKFGVWPVMGNADIKDQFEKLKEDSEVQSMVLLNCGASIDLQKHLEEVGDHVKCFVIDAHRPVMLENLSKHNQRVVVLDDDPIAEARGEHPPVEEFDESDASNSEDDKENEDDPNESELVKHQKRRLGRQERLRRKRRRLREHFLTSYHAMPVAMSVFQMARQAAPPSPDFLWLAAVALLGYMDVGLMSEHQYSRLAWEELKEALDSANSGLGSNGPTQTGDDSDEERQSSVPVRSAEKGRLRFESDLRLTLYKHWTLEESMMHSAYVYGTFELHRDVGVRTLKCFFATSGLVPSDYTQVFRHMSAPVRTSLRKLFAEHGKAYGFTENRIFLDQFVQDLNVVQLENLNQLQVSSSDVVHIIISMLCGSSPALEAVSMAEQKDHSAVNRLEKEAMWDNFYRAYDAVMCDNPSLLRQGIVEAVDMAKAVQTLARQIRDTKAMKATKRFRWCKIDQPPIIFRHPLAVRKLAMWLSQTLYSFKAQQGSELERPLLVVVRDVIREAYLCVGATPPSVSDQDEFGSLFREVFKKNTSLRCCYDFFDKSCIEVHADDIDRFLTALKLIS